MDDKKNTLPWYEVSREGGVHISDQSDDFPEDVQREIKDHLMELWTADDSEDAVSVYPLEKRNGYYLFSISKQVQGMEGASRSSWNVKGYICPEDHMLNLLKDLSQPDQNEWIEEYKNNSDAIYSAIEEIIEKDQYVWINEEDKAKTTALQYVMYESVFSHDEESSQKEKKKLYTISFGECIGNKAAQARIIIAKSIRKANHLDDKNFEYYKEHSIEQFLLLGEDRLTRERTEEERKKREQELLENEEKRIKIGTVTGALKQSQPYASDRTKVENSQSDISDNAKVGESGLQVSQKESRETLRVDEADMHKTKVKGGNERIVTKGDHRSDINDIIKKLDDLKNEINSLRKDILGLKRNRSPQIENLLNENVTEKNDIRAKFSDKLRLIKLSEKQIDEKQIEKQIELYWDFFTEFSMKDASELNEILKKIENPNELRDLIKQTYRAYNRDMRRECREKIHFIKKYR